MSGTQFMGTNSVGADTAGADGEIYEQHLRFLKSMKAAVAGTSMMMVMFGLLCIFSSFWIFRHHISEFMGQYLGKEPTSRVGAKGAVGRGAKIQPVLGFTHEQLQGYDKFGGRGFRPPDTDRVYRDAGRGPAPPPSPPKRKKNIVR